MPTQEFEFYTTKPKDAKKLTEENKNDLKVILDMCDGLLFPGGYMWYEFEEYAYSYAYQKNMPVLGICAGMQMMACVDLDFEKGVLNKNGTELEHRKREKKYVHNIIIEEGTLLKQILGVDKVKVNSKHRYSVKKVKNLKISAYSEDGLIEAIEEKNKDFMIGVQWHPESMIDYDEYANKLITAFIKKCKENND